MTRLSRRAFAGTSSAALLVLLTACSSSEGEADDSGAAGSSDSGGATGADGAITVEHAFGTTEIPAAPERITTVAWANHEGPLALGVVPPGMAAATFGDEDDNGTTPTARGTSRLAHATVAMRPG